MLWFSSDFHFQHNKNFVYEKRGFKTIEEMNYKIIDNLWRFVGQDDDLYLLGDNILGDAGTAESLLQQVPGHVHYIIGNHDSNTRLNMYDGCMWDCEGYATIIKSGKWRFYLSHYPTNTSNYDDVKKGMTRMLLSLCGHTHSQDMWESNGSFNVGVDAHNCMPVSIENIKDAFLCRYGDIVKKQREQ